MDIQTELAHTLESILEERDEVLLQLNLAKMEVKDEWEQAEEKLERLVSKIDRASEEALDGSRAILESVKELGDEIRIAYDKVKSHF